MVEAFRYNKWANLYLLDVCAKLSERELQLTAPGTYGTIAATWQHLVNSERRYIWRLGGDEGRFTVRHKFPGIAVLRQQAVSSGDQLIVVARRAKSNATVDSRWKSGTRRVHVAILLLQALHHGNDHRTHLCTILGHHGIPYDEMDVWAYGEATGTMVPIGSKG
ncbi:MAG TPA: DinB family protein [Candidatus Dormibacteraeota bacterium]|nr:DinB family protein [Candidatus Dormibacteraeota bacterium]